MRTYFEEESIDGFVIRQTFDKTSHRVLKTSVLKIGKEVYVCETRGQAAAWIKVQPKIELIVPVDDDADNEEQIGSRITP